MRQQIAAANWKMNLKYDEAQSLLDEIVKAGVDLAGHQRAVFAVPFPYLALAAERLVGKPGYAVAAQNCSDKKNGAYTGQVSAEMLQSVGIGYCIVGHSERREYNRESNQVLAAKVDLCLEYGITPIFCCGEPLSVRESGDQNDHVYRQLQESLFHLQATDLERLVIAYEPIWAIGTGKTASTEQAQEMHAHIRQVIRERFGNETADRLPLLYGGSVKASNAEELFAAPDVDGGLVGGASLVATEFVSIIKSLKK